MADYYVVSARNRWRWPAQGCFVEFEDLLVACCQATLITPERATRKGVLDRFNRPLELAVPSPRSRGVQVLIVVAISSSFVFEVLNSIPNWRKRFDVVCAFVSDAWVEDAERRRPEWRQKLSRFHRTIGAIDHLFVPMTNCVQDFSRLYGISVSMLPMACDVLQFGSAQSERSIDVIGYGRQQPVHAAALARAYNDPSSPRLYYHTDHMHIDKIVDFYAHRRQFWKILQRSKIALAYDPLIANTRQFPFSFVGQRWFECITAGCLIIGRRPTCPEMNELFAWEDSTVEVPEGENELLEFVDELMSDQPRLVAASQRNYKHALGQHDWRHRIADMHNRLSLEYPEALNRQLESIHRKHESLT